MTKSAPFMYQRVKDALVDIIAKEKLNPGDKLPSERDLAKRLGCNYQTVRRGLAILTEEQLIERRVGAGTFLLKPGTGKGEIEPAAEGTKRIGKGDLVKVKPFMGVITSSAISEFDRELLGHLHHQAQERGFRLSVRTVGEWDTEVQESVREFADHGCFAVIVPRLGPVVSPERFREMVVRLSVPVVMSQPVPGLEKYCYESPEVYGRPTVAMMEMACRYFKELGYGEIAFFGGNVPLHFSLQGMVTAYSCFVSREGMAAHLGLATEMGPGGPKVEDVDRIVKDWSRMAGKLAVVCWGDEYALRLMISLHKHGLRIPEDVAVLGSGDIPLAKTFDPPLSTVRFDYDYVAGAMLDHALALKQGKSAQASGIARQVLVVRDSCGGRLRAGDKLPEILERVQKIHDTIERQPDGAK